MASFSHPGASSVGAIIGDPALSPAFRAANPAVASRADATTAAFPRALAGGQSITEALLSTGFEESVLVPNAAAGPSYTDLVSLPAGITAHQAPEGVTFVDSAGTVVGIFGTGLAHDSSPGGALGYGAETPAATTLVSEVGSIATISVSVSASWFANPARVFPISIDPVYETSTTAAGGYDNYVASDNCTGAYSTQTQLRVGSPGIEHEACADPLAPYAYNPASYSRTRTLLYFDLASIQGDNHVVTSATLYLMAFAQASASYGYDAYALTATPNAATDWANQPAVAGPYEADQVLSGTGYYNSMNVTSLVNAQVDTSLQGSLGYNDGMELRASGASGANEYAPASFRDFYSAESGSGAPVLDVTYTVPPSAPTNFAATPGTTSTALSWSPSSSDGGACVNGGSCPGIGSYLVTTSGPNAPAQFSVTCMGTASCTSAQVSGLTNGAAYTFWVQAQSAYSISSFASTTASIPAALGSAGPYKIDSTSLGAATSLGINVASGNAVVSSIDLSIPGVGVGLSVTRTLNSQASGAGAFGNRTSSNLGADVHLIPQAGGAVLLEAADGSAQAFAPAGAGSFLSPPDLAAALTQDSTGGAYTLTLHPSGAELHFSSSGQLSSVADNNANAITFTYNPDGTLASITDTQGRIISVASLNGRIASITDPSGRTESYAYDSSGNLTTYTDGSGKSLELRL